MMVESQKVSSDMYAQQRSSSKFVSEPSLGAFLIAKDARFLQADNKDSD